MRPERDAPFSRRTVGWIAAVSVASFLLAFVLAGFGDDLAAPRSAGSDAFSYSALGHRGLVDFLEEIGLRATVRRARGPAPGPTSPLVALEPANETRDGVPDLSRLRAEARDHGATLVVALPKWLGRPRPLRPGWIERIRPLADDVALDVLVAGIDDPGVDALELVRDGDETTRLDCRTADGASLRVELRRAQLFAGGGPLETVVGCGDRTLVGRLASISSPVYLLSDPDVLNNQGLGRADHGRLIATVVRDVIGARSVVVDERHHGFAQRAGLLAELLRFPLVLAVVHGLGWVALVVWAGAARVGKPLPAPAPALGGKVALIDNAAKLLAGSGHSVRAVRRYFEQTLRAAGAHYFLPAELPHDELVERLQAISRARGVRYDLRNAERRVGSLERSAASAERSVRLALELHRWREELTDGTRTHP